jgi:hypothetical protein
MVHEMMTSMCVSWSPITSGMFGYPASQPVMKRITACHIKRQQNRRTIAQAAQPEGVPPTIIRNPAANIKVVQRLLGCFGRRVRNQVICQRRSVHAHLPYIDLQRDTKRQVVSTVRDQSDAYRTGFTGVKVAHD